MKQGEEEDFLGRQVSQEVREQVWELKVVLYYWDEREKGRHGVEVGKMK